MTIEEVIGRVLEIERISENDEEAHAAQDRLYVDVLNAVAAGAENAAQLATEAIKVDDMNFSRWYA